MKSMVSYALEHMCVAAGVATLRHTLCLEILILLHAGQMQLAAVSPDAPMKVISLFGKQKQKQVPKQYRESVAERETDRASRCCSTSTAVASEKKSTILLPCAVAQCLSPP